MMTMEIERVARESDVESRRVQAVRLTARRLRARRRAERRREQGLTEIVWSRLC